MPRRCRGPMLRALLERRFQLKAHVETEQIPAFALTVAKGGLKIKPAAKRTPVSRSHASSGASRQSPAR